MGISFSLLLSAAGAVLIWAVKATTSGINIHTVGVILLVLLVLAVGGGLAVSPFLFLLIVVAIAVFAFSRMGSSSSRHTRWPRFHI